jgi:predicted site-specific integrase-resolvase
MNPDLILDRSQTCRHLGISRQTLIAWVRRGKLKVWKRVGNGSNAALLFERRHIEAIRGSSDRLVTSGDTSPSTENMSS